MRQYTVPKEFEHLRLDLFLAKKLPGFSRSLIQKLIKDGIVEVNGRKIKKSSQALLHNDEVSIDIKPPKKSEMTAEDIPLDIVYEDEYLLIVNKPFGMVVHPANGNTSGTLANALLHHCKGLTSIGGVERPGIVHRLDKDTSGIMVVAKTDTAHNKLSKMFKDRTITKKYLALVHGNVKNDSGTIIASIGRSQSDRKKMAVIELKDEKDIFMNSRKPRRAKSRQAITHYNVLKRNKDTTLLELKLETGRTHQIRVHLAYIHHPIVGDKVYGLKKDKTPEMALHSFYLSFKHPVTGELMEFKKEKVL